MEVREAADFVGRTPETVRRWVWSGRLAAQRRGNRLLLARADLDRLRGEAMAVTLAQWAQSLPSGEPGAATAADLVLADRAEREQPRARR